MEIISHSESETKNFAKKFLKDLIPIDIGATVVAFYGDLGTGKTTLIKNMAEVLGIKESVQSPTFIIQKRYSVTGGKFSTLIHIDAYRLEKSEELSKLGFRELAQNKNNLIFIEWAERVEDILPKTSIKIHLEHISEKERKIISGE